MQDRVNNTNNNVRKFYKAVIQEISIDKIMIGKYQKALNKKRVLAIVADFEPDRMRPIEVSFRDGCYWCYDGQHRLSAYKILGFEAIPCQVHFGMTYRDEALAFANQQVNVGSITSANKFNALREANEPTIMSVINKCAEYKFKVHPTGAGGHTIRAVKTLEDIVKKSGINRLETIVWMMHSAWNHESESTKDDVISGIATFLDKTLVPERCAKDYDHNKLIIDRLHNKLCTISAAKLLQKSTEMMVIKGGDRRVAMVLSNMFNENLRSNNPLRVPRFWN